VIAGATDGIYISADAGGHWQLKFATLAHVSSVASSADGVRLVAKTDNTGEYSPSFGYVSLYTSTNCGSTWTPTVFPLIRSYESELGQTMLSADGNRLATIIRRNNFAPGLVLTAPYLGPWRLANVPMTDWQGIAVSANGSKLIANGDYTLTSVDSGSTWIQKGSVGLGPVASSTDGTKLASCKISDTSNPIFTSTDSGATWNKTSAPNDSWRAIASSGDGNRLAAVSGSGTNGRVYTSLDAGITWTQSIAPNTLWNGIAYSSDGTLLAAVGLAGIYISTNSGVTWTQQAPPDQWTAISSSADGSKLFAAKASEPGPSGVYASADFGRTWIQTVAPTNYLWTSISCSADGAKVVGIAQPYVPDGLGPNPGAIVYLSPDAGITWASADAPAQSWATVTCSADSSNIVLAAAAGGPICTLRSPAPPAPSFEPPRLSVAQSGAQVQISWLVPSSSFVLQENADLATTNWTDVTTPPSLNFTNLHDELRISSSLAASFYRFRMQ
jgi:hypothetical protein